MASEENSLAPLSVQKNVISASLNGSMVQNFLMGVYSLTYAGTMYLYLSRKRPNKHVVISAITTLYVLCFSDFVIQWFWLNKWFVDEGDTRDDIFLGSLDGPSAATFVLDSFLFYAVFVVADALLIWRCFHVWGGSLKVVALPLLLLLAELGLLLAVIILGALISGPQASNLTDSLRYNNVITALIFVSLATTVLSTFLIGYRIHIGSRLHRSSAATSNSKNRDIFKHIIVVIVESAAVYALVLPIYAVFTVVPRFDVLRSVEFYVGDYVEILTGIIAAMAPTVLIARLALTDTPNSGSVVQRRTATEGLSELKFDSMPEISLGETNVSASASTLTRDVGQEGKMEEGKIEIEERFVREVDVVGVHTI